MSVSQRVINPVISPYIYSFILGTGFIDNDYCYELRNTKKRDVWR
jgi:hypothetical protein